MVYSARRFVLSLASCYFVLVFFSPFSIAITSLWEEKANLSAFCTFVRFALVQLCLFPFPLGAWEGLWIVIVTLPWLFSYLFFSRIVVVQQIRASELLLSTSQGFRIVVFQPIKASE